MNISIESATKSERSLADAPATVRVFTRAELDRNQWEYLSEMLNAIDGFMGIDHGIYSVAMARGIPDVNGTGNRLLVMLDGHILNSKLNGAWYDYDLSAAERVEVVIGPASCLYGADAFQGVVNIITLPAEGRQGGRAQAAAGSFDSFLGALTYKKTQGDFQFAAHLKAMSSEGFPIRGRALGPDGTTFASDDQSFEKPRNASLWLRYKGISAYYDHFNHHNGYRTYTNLHDDTRWNLIYNNFGIVAQASPSERAQAELRVYGGTGLGNSERFAMYLAPGQTPLRLSQREWFAGTQAEGRFQGERLGRLIAGAQFEHFDVSDFKRVATERPDTIGFVPSQTYHNLAGYLQLEKDLSPSVYLIAGLRYDYNSLFNSTLNPRGGMVFRLGEQTKLKMMYGQAFRAPDIYEMFTNDPNIRFIANPGLAPEKLKTFELSANTLVNSRIWLEALGYYNLMDDIIGATLLPDPANPQATTPTHTQYQNLGQADARGFTLRAILDLDWLKLSTGYTYNDSRDQEGAPLPNTNRNLWNNTIEIAPIQQISLIIRHFHCDEFTLLASNRYAPGKLPGFDRLDAVLAISRLPIKGLALGLRAENLTDVDAAFPGPRGGSGLFPGRSLYAPRAFMARVSYDF